MGPRAHFSTGGPHKLCDCVTANGNANKLLLLLLLLLLYHVLNLEKMYWTDGNVEKPRIIVIDCDEYSHLTSR